MSRHNILVAIDSPRDMTANQATSFVAGAIDTVRSNYLAMQRTGMLGAAADKFAENLGGSVICTSLQTPMRESFVKDVGMEVQDGVIQLLVDRSAKLTTVSELRHVSHEIINLIMRSQLVHPEARAIYEAMSGDPA